MLFPVNKIFLVYVLFPGSIVKIISTSSVFSLTSGFPVTSAKAYPLLPKILTKNSSIEVI
jgi:hypothetical protein